MISEAFTRARLGLKIVDPGTDTTSFRDKNVFRMIILKDKKHGNREYFFVNSGDGQVKVHALDADPHHRQVLLAVREPERTFTENVWSREEKRYLKVERKTPEAERRILAGMDQTHLFIAVLSNGGHVYSVADAHEALKPSPVMHGQGRSKRIKRQGEWFFIPATPSEERKIEAAIALGEIEHGQPLKGNGKSHVADLSVTVAADTFVSGKVRHADHHTLELKGWFRVARNTEDRRSVIASGGVRWVD